MESPIEIGVGDTVSLPCKVGGITLGADGKRKLVIIPVMASGRPAGIGDKALAFMVHVEDVNLINKKGAN